MLVRVTLSPVNRSPSSLWLTTTSVPETATISVPPESSTPFRS